MPRSVDLSGCWAKLDHAKQHVDALRHEIERAGAPDMGYIPMLRQYEPDEGAVVYRIGGVTQIRDHWSLIVGDAVHDLRSALDHLMWQLGIVYLGRQPKKTEARDIQFPEVRRLRDFNRHRFLKYVLPADVNRLKPFQPYKRTKRGELHPLPTLVRLSNIDKHRKLHLLVVIPQSASFTNRPDAFRDCVPYPTTSGPQGQPATIIEHIAPGRAPRAGDLILRIPVRPTGANPDVVLDARIIGYVGLGRLGPIIPMLDAIALYVSNVLEAF
jgi:hypothetical protein